jgi:phospholipid/cholesterol/gamma-HCH transport system substrate-binding protein
MSSLARQIKARRTSQRAGIVTIASLVGLYGFALTAQNGVPEYVPGVNRSQVAAAFDNVGALRAGDDVRVADVRAGFVQNIDLEGGAPVVHMKLNGGRDVYRDATAIIRSRSGLGQKYVDIDPGTEASGDLADGQVIPSDHTDDATDLDDALSGLGPKTREGLQTTLRQVGGGLAGRGADLNDAVDAAPELLGDLGTISGALAKDDGADTARLLAAANTLAVNLADRQAVLGDLVRQSATTLDAVTTDHGVPLDKTIERAPAALRALHHEMDALQGPLAETRSAAVALRPGAEALGAATPDLRGFLREAVPPLRDVPAMARSARPAVTSLTPALHEARPVVAQLGSALERAMNPLAYLSRYRDDVLSFFVRAESALHLHDQNGGWLRISLLVSPEQVGGLPVTNPLSKREAYPAPGTADNHRTNR